MHPVPRNAAILLRRGSGAGRTSAAPYVIDRFASLRVHEVGAAVLLPARFRAFRAEWLFFSVADGAHPGRRNSRLRQRLFGRLRSILAQRQVVLDRAAFVAVALNHETHAGMLLQEAGVRLDDGLILRRDVVA